MKKKLADRYWSLYEEAERIFKSIGKDKCIRFYKEDDVGASWASSEGDHWLGRIWQVNGDGTMFVGECIDSVDTVDIEQITDMYGLFRAADIVSKGDRIKFDYDGFEPVMSDIESIEDLK